MDEFLAKLEAYRSWIGDYPTTEQGLSALVTRPEGLANAEHWKQQFKALPRDPWNNPYTYQFPGSLDPKLPEIISSGPDRQVGTKDDISSQDRAD